jgi:hypothetical protein
MILKIKDINLDGIESDLIQTIKYEYPSDYLDMEIWNLIYILLTPVH